MSKRKYILLCSAQCVYASSHSSIQITQEEILKMLKIDILSVPRSISIRAACFLLRVFFYYQQNPIPQSFLRVLLHSALPC